MTEHAEGEELYDGAVRVVSYASFDALMHDQLESEQEALDRAAPEQLEITWGQYAFARGADGVQVFARIVDFDEHLAEELSAATSSLEKALIEKQIAQVYARGYRFGHWCSKLVPEGEWGTKHVAALWPITEEVYNEAAANDWQLPDQTRRRINDEIIKALPDDPIIAEEAEREQAIEQVIKATAEVLYMDLASKDQLPSEEFIRGMVALGMYLTDTDMSQAEEWMNAVRVELTKISIVNKAERREENP